MGKTFADAATLFAEMALFAMIKHPAMEKGLWSSVQKSVANRAGASPRVSPFGAEKFTIVSLQCYLCGCAKSVVFVVASFASALQRLVL